MRISERLPIEVYAKPVYKKCECCGRVQDVFYHMVVRDATTGLLLVGSFDLCAACGKELAQITNQAIENTDAPTEKPAAEATPAVAPAANVEANATEEKAAAAPAAEASDSQADQSVEAPIKRAPAAQPVAPEPRNLAVSQQAQRAALAAKVIADEAVGGSDAEDVIDNTDTVEYGGTRKSTAPATGKQPAVPKGFVREGGALVRNFDLRTPNPNAPNPGKTE